MSRTKRGIAYKHYWGNTKENAKKWAEEFKGTRSETYYERNYLLHGTDAKNWSPRTHYYFNRIHRIGRSVERDQLRPQNITEDFEFDDSRYRARYKGVWWDIY
jgi:hypothetical protein